MSQESRKERLENWDISLTAPQNDESRLYKGFEGMNYEQIRQPYNPGHKGRDRLFDQRNDTKRPDAA